MEHARTTSTRLSTASVNGAFVGREPRGRTGVHRAGRESGRRCLVARRPVFLHVAGKDGHHQCRRNGSAVFRFQGSQPGDMAAGARVPRRAAGYLFEYGAAARRAGAALFAILFADTDAHLAPRPQDRFAHRAVHEEAAGPVRDAGLARGRGPHPGAGRPQHGRPDVQHAARRERRPRIHPRERGDALRIQHEPRRPADRLSPVRRAGLPGVDKRPRGETPRPSRRQAGAPLFRHELVAGREVDPVRRLRPFQDAGARLGRRVHRQGRRQPSTAC